MLMSFDMETGKAECADPEDGFGQFGRSVALDGQLVLGLQLVEYAWAKSDPDNPR